MSPSPVSSIEQWSSLDFLLWCVRKERRASYKGGGFKKCDTRNQKKATDFDLVHLGGEVENYSCDFGNMLILNMRFLIRNLSKKKIKRMVNVGKEFGFRG